MARAAPTLLVDIALNTARLADDMGKAKGVVERGMRDVKSSVDTVKNTLSALGVTVAAGALVKLHYDAIKAAAALDDMAEATGSSVETLSKLQQIARVGGQDFGGLTDGIGRMIKGLKGADEGGQAAGRALDFLGVKAKDANGRFRDSGEILIDVAKALDGYEDGGNKVALVQDLLGKGAGKYLPLLKDIAQSGDVQATVTAKQAAEAEKFEKAVNRVGLALETARRDALMPWMGTFTEFAEQLSKGIELFGGFGAALLNIGVAVNPFKSLSDNIADIRGQLEAINRLRAMGVPTGDPATLERRIEFLKFMQRQEALRLATPDTLDARDLALRNMARPLTYQGGAGDREAEARARQLAELMAKTAPQPLDARFEELEKFWATVALDAKGAADEVKRFDESMRRLRETEAMFGPRPVLDLDFEGLQRFWAANEVAEQARVDERARREAEELAAWRVRNALENHRAIEEESRRAADAFEQAVTSGIMAGFRRGGGNLAAELRRSLEGAMFTAMVGPLAVALGSPFRSIGSAMVDGNWGQVGTAFSNQGFTRPTYGETASGDVFVSGGAPNWPTIIGAGVMGLGAMQQYRNASSSMNPAGEKTTAGLTIAGMAGGALIGNPVVGGLIGNTIGSFFGNNDGPAGRSAQIGGQFGAPMMYGNQWFGIGTESVPDYLQELGRREENLIRNLGITPGQLAQINAQVSGQQTFGFGQEWTPWESSGAAQKIEAERLKAVSETLGLSIQELTAVMAMSATEWDRAVRDMENSMLSARDAVSGAIRGLPGQLGISSLEGFQRSLALGQGGDVALAAARGYYDDTLARARAGDLTAVSDFVGSAQGLLGVGRDLYASGEGYQALFSEVTAALDELLAKQRDVQADILRDVPEAIHRASQDQIGELRRGFDGLIDKFTDLESEFRRFRNASPVPA